MSDIGNPKSVKLKIDECVKVQLDENLLEGVEDFIHFLKGEKISLPWTSGNGYDLKYKGKRIGKIYFRDERNRVELNIDTAERDKCDVYLEGQANEIIGLFMERIKNDCIQCRPTCGCSQGPGMTVEVSGNQYKNICIHSLGYHFIKSGGDMQAMSLRSPNATMGERFVVRDISIEAIKHLILARKKYIEKVK